MNPYSDIPILPTVHCNSCGEGISEYELEEDYSQVGRCLSCFCDVIEEFLRLLKVASEDNFSSVFRLRKILDYLYDKQIPIGMALKCARDDLSKLVEAKFNNKLPEDIVHNLASNESSLQISGDVRVEITTEFEVLKQIIDARNGILPTARGSIILPSDEVVHHESLTQFTPEGSKAIFDGQALAFTGPGTINGNLIATDRRLVFISSEMKFEVPYQNIIDVSICMQFVDLKIIRGKGAGNYVTSQNNLLGEIIRHLVLKVNRQSKVNTSGNSRVIPQHVRVEVWQRDQGRCVECGAQEYLEFDHIIPFSKGGASSVNNLQLLCRKCNLTKSSQI